jgi:hypothetical protein
MPTFDCATLSSRVALDGEVGCLLLLLFDVALIASVSDADLCFVQRCRVVSAAAFCVGCLVSFLFQSAPQRWRMFFTRLFF